MVKRKTAKDRFARALTRVSEWCRDHRHSPIKEQWRELTQKVRGHYGYYGIIGNSWALQRFGSGVEHAWHQWLSRRSQRGYLNWTEMVRLLERYPLPKARLSGRTLPA